MPCNRSLGTVAALLLVVMIILVTAPSASAQSNYKTLHRFFHCTYCRDGAYPIGSLVFDAAGNLYGTTSAGGAQGSGCHGGCGTVFELIPNGDGFWKETILHLFTGGEDGSGPAGLTFDSHGNIFGITGSGGVYSFGTVFELTPKAHGRWKLKVLHNFNNTDEWAPVGLTLDSAGNLYGTTNQGGDDGAGTVFELTPTSHGSWKWSVLHSFNTQGDGGYPQAGVILGPDGSLYGTTTQGGAGGGGTVFELRRESDGRWQESVLHSFSYNDGMYPLGGLIFDRDGNLYGTTAGGGSLYRNCGQFGCGLVYELIPKGHGIWHETIVYGFTGDNDGDRPSGSLIFDSAGNLYGTTQRGGGGPCNEGVGCGTVFRLKTKGKRGWKEAILHSFWDDPGYGPMSGLIYDTHGRLYGTTYGDGQKTFGSVFEISP